MRQKYLVSMLCMSVLLSGCDVSSSQAVSCKLAVSLPDHSQKSIQALQTVISNAWKESNITGWSLYPVQGAWRPSLQEPFLFETSVIIEVLGDRDLIKNSQTLSATLAKEYRQKQVLVYCEPVIGN